MAFEFRGGIVFERGPAEAAADIRREGAKRRRIGGPGVPVRAQPNKQPDIQHGSISPRKGPQQEDPWAPMQLGLTPPCPVPNDVVFGPHRTRHSNHHPSGSRRR